MIDQLTWEILCFGSNKIASVITLQVKFCFFNISWFEMNSERDRKLLVVDNYTYRIDRVRENTKYYKRINNCGERVILNNGNAEISTTHSHLIRGIEPANRAFRNTLNVS